MNARLVANGHHDADERKVVVSHTRHVSLAGIRVPPAEADLPIVLENLPGDPSARKAFALGSRLATRRGPRATLASIVASESGVGSLEEAAVDARDLVPRRPHGNRDDRPFAGERLLDDRRRPFGQARRQENGVSGIQPAGHVPVRRRRSRISSRVSIPLRVQRVDGGSSERGTLDRVLVARGEQDVERRRRSIQTTPGDAAASAGTQEIEVDSARDNADSGSPGRPE